MATWGEAFPFSHLDHSHSTPSTPHNMALLLPEGLCSTPNRSHSSPDQQPSMAGATEENRGQSGLFPVSCRVQPHVLDGISSHLHHCDQTYTSSSFLALLLLPSFTLSAENSSAVGLLHS